MISWNKSIIQNAAESTSWLDELSAQQSCWSPLPNYKILIVEGPDAEKFLQGQCTCNLEQSTDNTILGGAHCNPQGRMLSNFALLRLSDDRFALRVHASIAEQALTDLKKYIVFSKATIQISADFLLAGIGYPEHSSMLRNRGLSDIKPGHFRGFDGGYALALSKDQCELWLSQPVLDETLSALEDELLVPEHQWDLLNIRRGMGEVREQLRAELLPQEVNLQLTGGVSFNKGCYTGQEIIARLHYKATLKKHMYRARLSLSSRLNQGDDLSADGKKAGLIVMAAPCSATDQEILALCLDSARVTNKVHLSTFPQSILRWESLPYAIPG